MGRVVLGFVLLWGTVSPATQWIRCLAEVVAPNTSIDPRFSVGPSGRLDVDLHDPSAPGFRYLNVLSRLYGDLVGVAELRQIYYRFAREASPNGSFFDRGLDAFQAVAESAHGYQERIPATGPLLVIANHTRFGVDTLGIASLISRVRSDVKVVFTQSFETLPGAADHGIAVATQTSRGGERRNLAAVQRMAQWLREGHVLVIHPAGEPASVTHASSPHVFDRQWQGGILRLLRQGDTPVLPVHVDGGPSRTFLRLASINTWLSASLLLSEVARVRGARMRVSFGHPVSPEIASWSGEDRRAAGARVLRELRRLTYLAAGIVEPGT